MSSTRLEFQLVIVVEPDGDEFHAYVPDLKGLHTCGSTEEEALQNAKEAAIAYIQSLIKHGEPIPIGACGPRRRPKDSVSRVWPDQRIELAVA